MRGHDAALAEPAEDIEEVNMDDRLLGKLQSDVEYIQSDVVQIKSDIREMKRDIGGLQQEVGVLRREIVEVKTGLQAGLQQLDAKIDRKTDELRAYIDLALEKMRGSNRVAFIAIIVLLVLTLMSSAPGAVATLLRLL